MRNNQVYETIIVDIENHVARVSLNRPEVHNAINDTLINELYDAFEKLKSDNNIRVIILTGNGNTFCAGGDVKWLKSVVNYTFRQNYEESLKLAKLMYLIFTHPKPVIARINGSALGGGVGLMSVCDILIADENATLTFSEVRLGLVPAVISPFIMCRIGQSYVRELFITGEKISAHRGFEIGLINQVVPHAQLDKAVEEKVNSILNNGPTAVITVKDLIFNVSQMRFPEVQEYTAELISNLRSSEEGQEGMNAFLEKRKPTWVEE